MRETSPSGCIEIKPTAQTVYLGGKPINVSAIARTQHIDQSYLSRILAGKCVPTIPIAQKIAAVVGLSLEQLLDAIQDRKKELEVKREELDKAYNERIAREDTSDIRTLEAGGIPIPRVPGMRRKSA